MKDTKLVRILSVFSPQNFRQFKEFVESPFFNKDKNLQKHLQYIYKFKSDFNNEQFTKERAFTSLFAKTAYNPQVINRLNSKLYNLVIKFIAIKEQEEDNISEDIQLLNFYCNNIKHNSALEDDFEMNIEKIRYKLNQPNIKKNTDSYYKKLQVEFQTNHFDEVRADKKKSNFDITNIITALDHFYFLLRLMLLCQQKSQISQPTVYPSFITELINYLPNSIYFEDKKIEIWYNMLQLYDQSSKEEIFLFLKKSIYTYKDTLDDHEIVNLCTHLQNMCRKVFSGKDYYQQLFDLYRFQLENGIFNQKAYFTSDNLFLNIVTVALRLQELEWTEIFLNTYVSTIPTHNDDLYELCLGLFYFEKKQYKIVLKSSEALKFSNVLLELTRRRLEIKACHELNKLDDLDKALNNFYMYLYRAKQEEKISIRHALPYEHFYKIMKKLFETPHWEIEMLKNLRKEIFESEEKNLPEKYWLEEKVEYLLSKTKEF